MPGPADPSKAKYMFSDDIKFLQKVIIFHPSENALLAIKRVASDKSRPDKWDLPGGNVEFGENSETSLKREIKEEIGLEIGDLVPIQVVTNFENGIYYLFIGYKTKALDQNVILSEEHSEYKWVTKEEFLTLDCGADFLYKLALLLPD